MNITATQTDAAPQAAAVESATDQRARPSRWRRVLGALASLRLTVALIVLAMVLVFAGTLAQAHDDIHTVTSSYFRTFIAWVELRIFFPAGAGPAGAVPMPGGYLLGAAMLVNLLAAHTIRFRIAARRLGIIAIHAGLIVLLIGELVTGLFAVEAQMVLEEGEPVNYIEHVHEVELAVVHADASGEHRETVVPASLLADGERVTHDLLPFDIAVERYLPNSRLDAIDQADAPADALADARHLQAMAMPPATGADPQQRLNTPSAELTLHHAHTGDAVGRVLVSWWLNASARPQSVEVDGERYDLYLRYQRHYLPYAIELNAFEQEHYPGSDIPRRFASDIRLIDPARGVDRDLRIEMNQPLRYEGRTFYQAAFRPDERASVLQVVSNPGWLIPYIAGTLVAVGLLMHFILALARHLRREATP